MAKKSNNTSAKGSPHLESPEAVYFLSLTVENVRCFGKRQTLDLSDGKGRPSRWTIILGNNGTGKTTLLQMLAGTEPVGLGFVTSENGHPPLWMPRLTALRDAVDFFRRRGAASETSYLVEFAAGHRLLNTATRYEPVTLQVHFSNQGAISSNGSSLLHEIPLRCYAYGAGRRLETSALVEDSTGDTTANLFSDKAELRNAEEWLLRLDYSASKPSAIQAQQRERLEQVRHLLLNILPEVEDIRFTSPEATNPAPQVEFMTPYGWVPLRRLGYGYQTLIAWVTDLASRMVERHPDSDDPLAEPAVVLVDEIDLHLHPQWQRKLIGFLTERFPNTQFIATAHSPLVVQAAADANLAVLKREGDHVVILNDVDDIRGWRVDQILTSDLFDLPTARPPQVEELLARRQELLAKAKLTASERRELEELRAKVEELPVGENAEQAKEFKLIRSALQLLEKRQKPNS